jgi:hypothetical protein
MREELNWWFTNVYKQKRVIRHELPNNHDNNRCFHERMGRSAEKLETINPNTLATSLIFAVCLFSNLSHLFAMIYFFSCGSETVIVSELIRHELPNNHDNNRCFHERMGRCSWSH